MQTPRDTSLSAGQFVEIVKRTRMQVRLPSAYQPIPGPHLDLLLLWGSLPRGHYLSVLLPESPQGQVPNYGQPLCPRACCNDPVQPTLSLLTLPHLRLPAETPKEASAHRWGFFVWPWVAPPLRNCNKISFQWQLSPDLLALPYLNNTKTYILKQCPGLEVSGGSPGGSKARMRPTGRGSKLRWGDGVTA